MYAIGGSNTKNSVVVLLDENEALIDNHNHKRVVHECCHKLSRMLVVFQVVAPPSSYSLFPGSYYQYFFRDSLRILTCRAHNEEADLWEAMSNANIEEEIIKKDEILLLRKEVAYVLT